MLDKSVPYFNVILKRDRGTPVPSFSLPGGFSFCLFAGGDERAWADIETSVGEFADESEALEYFRKEYLPRSDDLKRRLVFVRTEGGERIGTFACWWNFTGERRDASLHWFGVKPGYRDRGIGKALVTECLQTLIRLEGDRDVWLHTQTGSYKAIGIYLKTGFCIVEGETFGGYTNDYLQAMPVLREKMGARLAGYGK